MLTVSAPTSRLTIKLNSAIEIRDELLKCVSFKVKVPPPPIKPLRVQPSPPCYRRSFAGMEGLCAKKKKKNTNRPGFKYFHCSYVSSGSIPGKNLKLEGAHKTNACPSAWRKRWTAQEKGERCLDCVNKQPRSPTSGVGVTRVGGRASVSATLRDSQGFRQPRNDIFLEFTIEAAGQNNLQSDKNRHPSGHIESSLMGLPRTEWLTWQKEKLIFSILN